MKIVIGYRPWRGDVQVDAEDAAVLVVGRVEIEDPATETFLWFEGCVLRLDPFTILEIPRPEREPALAQFESLLEILGPEDVDWDSTNERVNLYVTEIELHELVRL